MPTFNENMVAKIQAALLESPLAKSVTIDGTNVSYDDAMARLTFFERRVARESGQRPLSSTLRLGPDSRGVNV